MQIFFKIVLREVAVEQAYRTEKDSVLCTRFTDANIGYNSADIGYIDYTRGVQPVARGKVLSGPWDFSEITNIINVIAT